MSRSDDIAAAEIAALVGGHLNSVDQKMVSRSSTGSASQIHPAQFLQNINGRQVQTTNNNIVPKTVMIQEPKSRPTGSEVVGTENVNLGNLMIPMDGADAKMREAIKHYSQAPAVPPPPRPQSASQPTPQPAPQPAPVQPQPVAVQPTVTVEHATSSEVVKLLNEINDKLDMIIKRAKIQPRYKKAKS